MELPKRKKKALLLGVGLDGDDQKLRITRGENYRLIGGSQDTHEQMQEKCVKFNEKLKDRKKQLEDLHPEEFVELASECKMNVVRPQRDSQ